MLEHARGAALFPGMNLHCSEGEVHVWFSNLRRAAVRGAYFDALLSEDERLRAARFNHPQQSADFVAGRGIVREILGRYLGRHGGSLRFIYGPRGKPALAMDADDSPLYFNLAHSGERMLLAVTRVGDIGADIEQLNDAMDLETLARRICTPRERAVWRTLPPPLRLRALMRYWTRKEALLKATGMGLARRLTEVDVSGARARAAACGMQAQWSLHDLETEDAYTGALAVAGSVTSIHHGTWLGDLAWRAELD